MSLLPINPASLGAPSGYSNGMLGPVGGRLLFVAGQIAWNEQQTLVSDDFLDQLERALENVLTVVREAGGEAEDVASLTLYVTDKNQYLDQLREVGVRYRGVMGRHFPAMALVEVTALLDPGALVEIQAQAILPPSP